MRFSKTLTAFLLVSTSTAFAQNGSCTASRIQANFLQNCQMAGMQYYDSFAGKSDSDKINSICRCVVNHFVVESNPGLDKTKCETPVRWIANFLKRDDSKAACGYF